MQTKTYAQIDEDGKVVNCILWDGVTTFNLSTQLIEFNDENPAHIGGTYVDGVFLPPPEEPEVPPEAV